MAEDIRTTPAIPVAGPDPVYEVFRAGPTISWGAIFAGVFVALLTFFAFTALGIAIAGIGLGQASTPGEAGKALGIGSAIWLIVTGIISLFAGGYAAGRASGVIPTRIGGIEGLVVAALFFLVTAIGVGTGLGALLGGVGNVVGTLGGTAVDIAQNPQVQSVVERALGDLELRSPPGEVVQTVTVRLLQGDTEGAKSYLAREAGITVEEAEQRLGQIRNEALSAAQSIGDAAAKSAQAAGWSLLIMILLGSGAALAGGAFGARRNLSRPLSKRDQRVALDARPTWSSIGTGAHRV